MGSNRVGSSDSNCSVEIRDFCFGDADADAANSDHSSNKRHLSLKNSAEFKYLLQCLDLNFDLDKFSADCLAEIGGSSETGS